MPTYEEQLDADMEFALREGSKHFAEGNKVHQTLRAITGKLTELQIPYAVLVEWRCICMGFEDLPTMSISS